MSNINNITGDRIVTKPSDSYAEGYDRIWGKKKEEPKSYPSAIILSNKIKCNRCLDIIESKHTHDFVTCSCGESSVDGGTSYLRRRGLDYTDFSEVVSEDDEDWFEKIRNNFKWGTFGPRGDQPKHYIKLKDLETSHIKAILETQQHINGTDTEKYLKLELEYRDAL